MLKPLEDSATPAANPPAHRPLRGEARSVPLATEEMPRALARYMELFRRVFPRAETFGNACAYVMGLLSALPRKNGEKMAEAIEGVANTEAVHRFMALSPWSSEELDRLRVQHALSVAAEPGEWSALIFDEVSQLKQGKGSVGVKRQYLGSEGKTANGQVCVTAHYADRRYDWPVTGRLYLPEDWAEDTLRRERAGVPDDIVFATKAEIVRDLLRRALSWGVPVRWVFMDSGYDDMDMLDEMNALHLAFCIGIKRDFMVRVPAEIEAWVPPAPAPRRGRPRKHVDPRSLPSVYRADEVLAGVPESAWKAVTYRLGTDGPLTKEFAAFRVQAATTRRTGPDVWLLYERPLPGQHGETKYYVVSPRREISIEELAQVAHRRPLIERNSYENGKGEVGLRDYQGRSWPGFHHHLSLAMLCLTWLNLQRQALPPGKPPLAPDAPPPSSAPSASPSTDVLTLRGRLLRLEVAAPSPVLLPIPRQLWESVQEVRRRLTAWCAITVQRTLALRATPLPLPTFADLC